jgi:hypothetical protein
VEYSRAGKIIKGAEKPVVSSRYEEDVYINNHQSVTLIKHITLDYSYLILKNVSFRSGALIGKMTNGDSSAATL